MASDKKRRARRQRTPMDRTDARRREFLRIIEVSDLLGESRASIYNRIKAGQIKAVQFGKTMRVHGPTLFEAIDRLVSAEQAPAA